MPDTDLTKLKKLISLGLKANRTAKEKAQYKQNIVQYLCSKINADSKITKEQINEVVDSLK